MDLRDKLHKKSAVKHFKFLSEVLWSLWPTRPGAKTISTRSRRTCSGKNCPPVSCWDVAKRSFCFSPSSASMPNEEKALWFHVVLRTRCAVTLRRSPGDILKPDLERYTRKTLVLQQSGDQRVHSPGRKEGFLLKGGEGSLFLEPQLCLHTFYWLTNWSSSFINLIFAGFMRPWNICREQKSAAQAPLRSNHCKSWV